MKAKEKVRLRKLLRLKTLPLFEHCKYGGIEGLRRYLNRGNRK